jgi:hypothetical protein
MWIITFYSARLALIPVVYSVHHCSLDKSPPRMRWDEAAFYKLHPGDSLEKKMTGDLLSEKIKYQIALFLLLSCPR